MMNNEYTKVVADYAKERVSKGFEFELEQAIWHTVLEVTPKAFTGIIGISASSGHLVVMSICTVVLVSAIVIRQRKQDHE